MEIQNTIPAHLDLQKIAVLYINKDEYKVLKPAIHSVRDHFQDTMIRRDTELSSDRIFLDENGLRHFWNVFNQKSKSLRRLIPENEMDVIEGQQNVNSPARRKGNQRTAKAKPTTTPTSTTKDGPKRKTPGRYSVRNKRSVKKKTKKALRTILHLRKKENKDFKGGDDKERTLVKTTFFCPFFGVMTMHSYIDDDDDKVKPADEVGDDKEKGKEKEKKKDKEKDKKKDKENY